MRFSSPLHKGILLKRYKRFLADVELADGTVVVVYCPNTGSMRSCAEHGATVYLSHNPSPKRKMPFTWELTATTGGFIGINTAHPNAIVHEALLTRRLPAFAQYTSFRQEVAYGQQSRIDILAEAADQPSCYIEVKNVTLREAGCAQFPDAVTARGLKHLRELAAMVAQGHRAAMFYLVNRPDCQFFRPAAHIDVAYADGLRQAIAAGVEVHVHGTQTDLEGIVVGDPLPWALDDA